MSSEFLTKFQKARSIPGVQFGDPESQSDYLLIERLPEEEITSKGGIIIAAPNSQHKMSDTESLRAHLGVIVWAGEGVKNQERFKAGTIVLLNEYSIRWYTTFPGLPTYTEKKLGLTLSSEIKMSFADLETFRLYSEALQSEA